MNYLQLCQRTVQECGISGRPMTLANQQGELARVIEWVRQAYLMVQNERDWNWLWRHITAQLAAGQQDFDPAQDWGVYALRWRRRSLMLDGHPIAMYDYQAPNPVPVQTQRPSAVWLMPDRTLRFNSRLDQNRTFYGEYYSTSEVLREDDDTPSMPEQYHDAILWQAVLLYADFEEAGALRVTAQYKLDLLRAQMLGSEITHGTPEPFA